MDVSEAQRLKAMEDENRRLKHLVADLSLNQEVLKAVIGKIYGPPLACKRELGWGTSLRKSIRPTCGLSPGLDEIRARLSS